MASRVKRHLVTSWILAGILFVLFSCTAFGQTSEIGAKDAEQSMSLPSFSIFKASRMWKTIGPNEPLNLEELESTVEILLRNLDVSTGAEGVQTPRKEPRYWFLPIVLYKSRELFDKNSWTVEEIQRGAKISSFIARAFEEPDLEITDLEQKSFRAGLLKIKNWFIEICKDDQKLASMIFTFDFGPFLGRKLNLSDLRNLELVHSVEFPEREARIELMRDSSLKEPMFLTIRDKNGKPLSAVGISGVPVGFIKNVEFSKKQIVRELQDFGYKISLYATWGYGIEYMHLYLDQSLKVRFYYVSW